MHATRVNTHVHIYLHHLIMRDICSNPWYIWSDPQIPVYSRKIRDGWQVCQISLCGPARIFTLREQFWLDCVEKARLFFFNAVLPELIGKCFFRPPSVSSSTVPSEPDVPPTTSDEDEHYCYCEGPESGKMIACDNPACPHK